MHNQIFWRLIWKEYRVQRGLWMGVVVLALFVQAVMLAVLNNEREVIAGLYSVAWLLPILYALASSAVLFAAEKEEGTFELLRTLPVTPLRLFFGKMCFCLVTCLAMILFLNVLAFVLASGHTPSISWHDTTNLAEFFPAVLVVGVFFSLMMNRVLNVLVATVITVLVLNLNDLHLFKCSGIAAFLFADVWLVRRWFLDESLVRETAGYFLEGIKLPVTVRKTSGLTHTKTETSPWWWRTWKRSLWLEYRHARRTIFVWIPLSLLLIAISGMTYRFIGVDFSYIIIPLAPFFLGLAVFRGHQHDGRIRFLTEQGIPPQLVWLNCQLVWGGLIGIMLVIVWGLTSNFHLAGGGVVETLAYRATGFSGTDAYFHLAYQYASVIRQYGFLLNNDFHNYWRDFGTAEYTNYMVRFYVWWAVVAYLAGQLCSFRFSRTVLATVAGMILATMGCLWLSLMDGLPVPLGLSLAPILVFWTVLSFVGLRRWSLGVSTVRTKLRTAAIFIGFHAIVIVTVIVYRIQQVPSDRIIEDWVAEVTGSAARLHKPGEPITASQQLYLQVDSLVQNPRVGSWWDEANRYKSAAWFEEHEDAVPPLLEAIRANEVPNPNNLSSFAITRFKDLLLQSGLQLTNAGQLDEALERYGEVLKFAELAALSDQTYESVRDEYLQNWHIGFGREDMVYEHLLRWAAHVDQTPERIRRAILLVAKHDASYPTIDEAWQTAYHRLRDRTSENGGSFHSDPMKMFLTLPWEKTRLLRIMDGEAFMRAQSLSQLEKRDVLTHPRWRIAWSEILYEMRYANFGWGKFQIGLARDGVAYRNVSDIRVDFESLFESYIRHTTVYRVCRLRLELLALRQEQGKLPEQLTATLPTLKPIDLIDPWSGNEFGYYPNGIPQSFRCHNDEYVEAATPFLWSVTREDRALIAEKGDQSLQFIAVSGKNDYRYRMYLNENPETSPLYRHDGMFPIPEAK
ncbi:MAG: ABC transporter permease [Planctomycetota bacterium]|nr:ABC transporter permease [Planctomycetota bacterium]